MTREEIVAKFTIEAEMERRGAQFRRNGREIQCLCPLHEDKSPSFRVNAEKRVWRCDPCNEGGSIIDLVMKLDGVTAGEAMTRLGGPMETNGHNGNGHSVAVSPATSKPKERGKFVCAYDYKDEKGEVVYRVCRYDPKDFRQCARKGDQWVWSMEGVRMVLYNLPAVMKAEYVWVVEGEKDADTINAIQFTATSNAGGAEKWKDSYSESLKGKHVFICGDNDEKGQKHVEMLKEKLKAFAKTIRLIELPKEFKDVTLYAESFATQGGFADAILVLAENAEPLIKGFRVPVKSMADMEIDYMNFAKRKDAAVLSLSSWIPSLACVRPLVGGELVTIVADTGVGKTMLLQNLALYTNLTTLLFEIELPDTLTFERFVAMATKRSGGNVYSTYSHTNDKIPWRETGKLDHIHVCGESRLAPEDIERIIELAGLKIGHKPALVLVDYIQLIKGKGGSRYERASNVAEEMKIVAKNTNTVIVMASQIHRKGDDATGEIFLHDAKDSGSIENSSGLVIGAWRSEEKNKMWLKVMKNTKGYSGKKILCQIAEDSLLIHEETNQPEPE